MSLAIWIVNNPRNWLSGLVQLTNLLAWRLYPMDFPYPRAITGTELQKLAAIRPIRDAIKERIRARLSTIRWPFYAEIA